MPITPATDSAVELRNLVGDDATATFEEAPNFVESNPTANASTESLEVQRDTDDLEDSEGEDEEVDDEDEDDDEDDIGEGVDDEDEEEDDIDTDKVAA